MTRRRTLLSLLLLAAIAAALAVGLPREAPPAPARPDDPLPLAQAPATPEAERLAEHAGARARGDVAALAELAEGDDVAAYRAARDIVGLDDGGLDEGGLDGDDLANDDLAVDAELRLAAAERVLALRLDEPLARRALRELHLTIARAAEEAGRPERAVAAYREALPADEATDGLERLVDDPYRRANLFLQSGRHRDALDALDGRAAPSIEAPALRALGRHDDALDAYRRWLDEDADDLEARFGVAWSHWYLGDLDAAEAAFEELPGGDALYGRALIANRRGDVGEAVRLLRASGGASRLWLATSLLENDERWSDAIDVYLDLAAGSSSYADDAAWRARVLAAREGDDVARARAEEALPSDSYFALRLDAEPPLPSRDDLDDARPDALATAAWLAEAGDAEGARLVLAFALRDAESEAEIVPLGEALVALDEYREPQRRAAGLVAAGSEQLRTWRLAYPRAWPQHVGPAAKEAGIDPELAWAVMRRESAFYPEAVSRSGAQGLMQVMPATWTWLAELQDEPPGDPFDVTDNVRYGVHYLGWLQDYFRGDLELAVASYNRGQGYIGRLFDSAEVRRDFDELLRAIDALETREYLQAVWRTYRVYVGLERLEAEGRTGTP